MGLKQTKFDKKKICTPMMKLLIYCMAYLNIAD